MSIQALKAIEKQLTEGLAVYDAIGRHELRKENGFVGTNGATAWQVFKDEAANVIMSEYSAGSSWPKHTHDVYEFLIVTAGKFIVTVYEPHGVCKIHLGRDGTKCFLVVPGVIHEVTALTDCAKMIAVCLPPEKAYE
jgi:quercetin dioxygenase-like cupin family protein